MTAKPAEMSLSFSAEPPPVQWVAWVRLWGLLLANDTPSGTENGASKQQRRLGGSRERRQSVSTTGRRSMEVNLLCIIPRSLVVATPRCREVAADAP
jgi:hypothetical protein